MAQPTFVPVPDAERVRPSIRQPVPSRARAGRPGELRSPSVPQGRGVGQTGPDSGFALSLAHRIAPRLHLRATEDRHDVERGIALLASRRAALSGRAPCIYDVEIAAALFGYLDDATDGLVAYRSGLFSGLGHDYVAQRALIDAVPDAALSVTRGATIVPASWRDANDA